MGRHATTRNLLKFKMIFCSPMGMPFACSTAVTNRCNLPIMWLHYSLLYTKPLILNTSVLFFDERTCIWMTLVNGDIFIQRSIALHTENHAAYSCERACVTRKLTYKHLKCTYTVCFPKVVRIVKLEQLTNSEKPENVVLIWPSKSAWV